MKRRSLLLVLAVAAVVVVAGVSVYVLTRPPPIPLTVSDGSTDGVAEADFGSISSTNPYFAFFNVTTTATHTGLPTSTLTLRVRVVAYGWYGGYILNLYIGVAGHVAADLRPSGLALTYNEAGKALYAHRSMDPTETSAPFVNVSSCSNCRLQLVVVVNNGSGSLTPTLLNQGGPGPYYDFSFPPGSRFLRTWA